MTGAPPGPGCHRQRSNLSTSEPLRAPNRRANPTWSRVSRWTASTVPAAATSVVWLVLDNHTMNRGGEMLHCAANPTRQPARRSPSAHVTTYIG